MYITRINSAYFLGLLALCLLSCSEESSIVSTSESTPLDVEVRLEEGATTRAGGTPVTTEGEEIGVFRTTDGGYKALCNVKYKYTVADGGSGQWISTEPIYMDNRKGKIVAYYDPKNKVNFTDGSFVTNNQLQAQKFKEDALWYFDNSHQSVNNENAQISFAMKPAYSRIKLSIQRHTTNYVSGDCAITNVNLKSGADFYINNSMDISKGEVQGNATGSGWDYDLNIEKIAAGAINTDYDVMVPPQPVSSGLTITLTIDGTDRAITIPANQFTDNALAAGHQYTIALTITDTAVTSDSVTIKDYETDSTTEIKNDNPKEL